MFFGLFDHAVLLGISLTFVTLYFWRFSSIILFICPEVKNRCGLRQHYLAKQQVVVFFFRYFLNSLNTKEHIRKDQAKTLYFGCLTRSFVKGFLICSI